MTGKRTEGVIYKATCKITKRAYIGQTTWSMEYRKGKHEYVATKPQHRCHSVFHRAIAKYGKDAFDWEVLLTCNAEDLDMYEERAIEMNRTMVPHGYNVRSGGTAVVGGTSGPYKRKRPQGENLPKYVMYYNNSQNEGYNARVPSGDSYLIVSSRYTMAEKLAIATAWVQTALQGNVERPQKTRKNARDDGLPTRIYYRKMRDREGYEVNVSGGRKTFMSPSKTMSEKLRQAVWHKAQYTSSSSSDLQTAGDVVETL